MILMSKHCITIFS